MCSNYKIVVSQHLQQALASTIMV